MQRILYRKRFGVPCAGLPAIPAPGRGLYASAGCLVRNHGGDACTVTSSGRYYIHDDHFVPKINRATDVSSRGLLIATLRTRPLFSSPASDEVGEFWATTCRGRPLAVEVWIFNSDSQRRRRAHFPTLEFWATTRRGRSLAVEVWIFNSDSYGAIYT